MECMDFAEKRIPEGHFFVTGETVSTAESHRDEVHEANVRKMKEKFIIITTFKTDAPPIL